MVLFGHGRTASPDLGGNRGSLVCSGDRRKTPTRWTDRLSRLLLILLLGLIAAATAAHARYSNPQVQQGGSATFAYTGSVHPASGQNWDIVTSGGGSVASYSQPNGWSVTFSSPNFTVTAPATASTGTGFVVRLVQSNTQSSDSTGASPNLIGNNSYYSAPFDVIAGSPPAAPTGLTATPGNAKVVLSWTASTGASSYNVYRSTVSGTQGSKIQSGITAVTWTDTTVTNGTTYYYEVSATSSYFGEGKASAQVYATPNVPAPAAPTNLAGTPGNATASLTWTGSSGATSYIVLRSSTSGSGYTQIASGVTATSYTDSGLTNWQTYYYVVEAANAGGISPYSNQATVLLNVVPAAPTGLAGFGGDAFVSLTWNPVSTATSYTVYWASLGIGGPGKFEPLSPSTTNLNFLSSGWPDNVAVYFRVTATNSYGEGPPSSYIMLTPAPCTGGFSPTTFSETLGQPASLSGAITAAPTWGISYYPNNTDPFYWETEWSENFYLTSDTSLIDALAQPQGVTASTFTIQDFAGPGQPTFNLSGYPTQNLGNSFQMPTSGGLARLCLVAQYSCQVWFVQPQYPYLTSCGSVSFTWIAQRMDLNVLPGNPLVVAIDSRKVYGQPDLTGEVHADANAPLMNPNFSNYTYQGGLFVGNAAQSTQDQSGTARLQIYGQIAQQLVNPILSTFLIVDTGPVMVNGAASSTFGSSETVSLAIPATSDPNLSVPSTQAAWSNAWSLANASVVAHAPLGSSTVGTYVPMNLSTYSPQMILALQNEAGDVSGGTSLWRYFASAAYAASAASNGVFPANDGQPRLWVLDQTYHRP